MAILNFGSIIIDHVYRVPHFVRPGETLPCSEYRIFAGGKGFNQTLAMARAGVVVNHAGAIGPDGQWLMDLLVKEGIGVADIVTSAAPTGHGVIQVTELGANAILQFPGANRTITREQIEGVLNRFGAGDLLVLQNEISELDYLVRRAHARGLRIALNPAPMDAVVASLPPDAIGLLVVNEVEAQDLTGASTPSDMLRELRRQMPQTAIVLTLGEQGAIYEDSRQHIETPAWPIEVVDTTAAGDTFTGYLLASLEQGLNVADAMRRAARAAALCVSRLGAAASIPYAREVDSTD